MRSNQESCSSIMPVSNESLETMPPLSPTLRLVPSTATGYTELLEPERQRASPISILTPIESPCPSGGIRIKPSLSQFSTMSTPPQLAGWEDFSKSGPIDTHFKQRLREELSLSDRISLSSRLNMPSKKSFLTLQLEKHLEEDS